jgi:methyl-accepting chemotaxis protein
MNRELNKSVAEIAVRDEEYGAGFSIVASEVGNLAKRTAGVAKTTAERIRETVKKTIQADTEKAVRTASASQNMNLRSERMRRMTNKLASISSH